MNYSAISIQGNIISSEILEKIRTEDIRFQKALDFNLHPGASVRDEINLAWSLAVSHWNAFKLKREALLETDSGTAETRRYWMLPLLSVLGYEISSSNAEIINAKSYAISHRANNLENFPLHLVGVNQSLDKRPDTGGTRLSPHALVQEYINNTEHTYGLVSNGKFLRLLRDATRLSRLSYLEFDLEQMMEEGLYVEFALLYRTLHASRMADKPDSNEGSILEFYHLEAIASGSRIRERLSIAVESSIRELANGLLHHPQNEALRQLVLENKITPKEYYLYTLRLVYRMLFLLVIEERKLIYADKRDEELNKKRNVYYDYYSIQRLTKLAVKMVYVDPRKSDLWHSLLTTFALFEYETYGKKLGIAPLGSGLFAPDALGVISEQMLDNECLLKVIRYLVTFDNPNGQRVRVNYADLDVEEFGSVYEGLLEYDPVFTDNQGQPIFSFVEGDARSRSGSHYTPEELVKPLITHSLDYLIADKLKEVDPEAGLLSLSVCDVACGSGHILLSAARRIGFELAKYRSKEDQPTPTVLRAAIRDVIKNCIYGVDLNPLAVELCKVALWLEAHQPGEPLNFLDHHIKCGNAIVGLAHVEELNKGIATEAFKALPGDDKELAAAFKKRNEAERKAKDQLGLYDTGVMDESLKGIQKAFAEFNALPEQTPEQIAKKEAAYQSLMKGAKWWRIKELADLQVAQFFIPKTEENKDRLTTQHQYMNYLRNGTQIIDRGAALSISQQKRFFHWFLEFPEVFAAGGFDCILGNPPYLGGQKISGNFGFDFLEYVKFYFNSHKSPDLVTYFLLRNYSVLKDNSFEAIITTNSINQGKTREEGLEQLLNKGAKICFAIKSKPWPGVAGVHVSLLSLIKGGANIPSILENKKVDFINSYLDNNSSEPEPVNLINNKGVCFQGYILLGSGFIIEKKLALEFLNEFHELSYSILPYINGDELNSEPEITNNYYAIDFSDKTLTEIKEFKSIYSFLEKTVLPQRIQIVEEKIKKGQELGVHDSRAKDEWWRYLWPRPELRDALRKTRNVISVSLTTKYLNFQIINKNNIFSHAVGVISNSNYSQLTILNSILHEEWSRKYSSSLESRLRYTPSICYETFPFPQKLTPQQEQQLEAIGEAYHEHRRQLMLGIQLGLTKTYNLFHSNAITPQSVNLKDKQVISLQKHLEKIEGTISLEEAIKGILHLRQLHIQMDNAVLDAYGWGAARGLSPSGGGAEGGGGLSPSGGGKGEVSLRHNFYEVDYLPENDRIRFTIHPDARKEVLKRLLELNHQIHEQEVKAGLWDKKGGKKKANPSELNEPEIEYGLFKKETE